MIEYLQGQLLEKRPNNALVLCGGVGYGVNITLATYEELPDLEQDVGLYTYLSVREDALVLFGFSAETERDMFILLTGVSGVGPKTAIGMLSGMGANQLRDHIAASNTSALTSLPGIGKKSAERLVLELRDKVERVAGESVATIVTGEGAERARVRGDALSALIELGYNRGVAEKAIRAVLKNDSDAEASVESMIKAVLRQMQR